MAVHRHEKVGLVGANGSGKSTVLRLIVGEEQTDGGQVMVDRGTGSIRELHDKRPGRIYVHAVTQLEISSTELRQLIISGRDPRYLVPDEVRAIIRETKCYAPRQR